MGIDNREGERTAVVSFQVRTWGKASDLQKAVGEVERILRRGLHVSEDQPFPMQVETIMVRFPDGQVAFGRDEDLERCWCGALLAKDSLGPGEDGCSKNVWHNPRVPTESQPTVPAPVYEPGDLLRSFLRSSRA